MMEFGRKSDFPSLFCEEIANFVHVIIIIRYNSKDLNKNGK